LGVFIAVPLNPVLQSPTLKPAFDYVISALFGGLVAQTVLKSRKHFMLYLPPLAVNLFFFYYTKINAAYYMLIALAVAVMVSVTEFRVRRKSA
jgi:hypothetical protein